MKIIYSKRYVKRDIFLIEYQGKVLMVYRSSGLSGTGHGGELLPFFYLEEKNRINVTIGYIYKEMVYKEKLMNHRKELYAYPKVLELMNEIKDFVKDIELEEDPLEKEIFKEGNKNFFEEFEKYISLINAEMALAIKKNELSFFDYADL